MSIRTTTVVSLGALALASQAMCAGAQAPSPPGEWTQTAYVKAANAGEGDQFGQAVALSTDGTTLAVGAPMENSAATGVNGNQADDSADDAGAVYVYVQRDGVWEPQAYLKASNAETLDQFGNLVALSADGNTLAVAAYFEDGGATGPGGNQADNSVPQSGAVYVFTRNGTSWSQQAYLKASNVGEPDDGDTFGFALDLSADGNTLAVGAPSEDSGANQINGDQTDNSAIGAGAAYVFTRTGGAWTQQAYMKAANAHGGMLFGYSVGLSADGGTLAVGAYDERGCSNTVNGSYEMNCGGTGAAYVFTRNGTDWSQEAYLKAREQDRGDSMGGWLAISDDGRTVAVGAHDEDSLTIGVDAVESGHSGRVGSDDDNSSGAAYAFELGEGGWSQQASFKASNTGRQDWFGSRFAISGDGNALAVSSPNEDSAATGINGNQDDESALEAGAVYLFERSDGVWTHQAYVKSSNTDEFDEFGSSVAISGDGRMMAVGARFEDSSGNDQADNSLIDAGAVYVFTR
jgi:hypothetical protein